jgi:Uma2 family endonuclease
MRAIVSIQNPLRLNNYNEPVPDIVVLKPRGDYYATKSHTPEDTFFAVEVSDSTLRYDTKIKLPIYARTGVVEMWSYNTQLTLRRGESISPLAFPDVAFKVEDLLG